MINHSPGGLAGVIGNNFWGVRAKYILLKDILA
jgi:hypothetical protein